MFEFCAFTSKGVNRKKNEDRVMVADKTIKNGFSCGSKEESLTAVICDGVGSIPGGDKAAEKASNSFIGCEEKTSSPRKIDYHLHKVNKKITSDGNMASTIAGISIYKRSYISFNLGDTRIYRYRNNDLTLISKDHIVAIDPYLSLLNGKCNGHAITRYLGGDGCACYPTLCRGRIEPEDQFLLCSDGIYKVTKDTELKEVLSLPVSLKIKVKEITSRSLANRSDDDLSIVIIRHSSTSL